MRPAGTRLGQRRRSIKLFIWSFRTPAREPSVVGRVRGRSGKFRAGWTPDRQPVRLADEELVRRINAAVAAGTLVNRDGEPVTEPIQAGIIREDGQYLYPVRDDIPIMLIGEAIEVASVPSP